MPTPGAPMIMLNASYYGPDEDAERAATVLFDEQTVGKAIKAETTGVPISNANAAFEALNQHGAFKDISSCFVKSLDTDTIQGGFDAWLDFTAKNEAAKATVAVMGRHNTEKLQEIGETDEGKAKFFQSRDRGIVVYTCTICTKEETIPATKSYASKFLALYRRNEVDGPRTFANNFRPGMSLSELHSDGKIEEVKRVKKIWDKDDLFWHPYEI